MLLLKFLTNRFKSIGTKIKKDQEVSFTKSTIFLAFTELLMVVLGILLALYIDRWNTSKNFEKQFEATLRIVQQNIESDIYNSDHVIAHSYGGAVATLLALAGDAPLSFTTISAPTKFALVLSEISAAFNLSGEAERIFSF